MSLWGYFAVLTCIYALASRIAKGSEGDTTRFAQLDGLRGFLAASVFVHHVASYHKYFHTGSDAMTIVDRWDNFYNMIGDSPVMVFFLLSAFLFWSKALQGQYASVSRWGTYLTGRIRRLGPVYWLFLALNLVGLAWRSGFRLHQPLGVFLRGLLSWIGFGVGGTPNLNGLEPGILFTAGAAWTLRYEIYFYLLLPVLALSARVRGFIPMLWYTLAAVTLGGTLLRPGLFWRWPEGPRIQASIALLFVLGMCTAHWKARFPRLSDCSSRIFGIVPLAVIAALWGVFIQGYAPRETLLCWLSFIPIAFGNDVFGLLRTRASVYLGRISYSFYLMHGIVLYAFFVPLSHFGRAIVLNEASFWIAAMACGVITIGISDLSYRYVELPFLKALKAQPRSTSQRISAAVT